MGVVMGVVMGGFFPRDNPVGGGGGGGVTGVLIIIFMKPLFKQVL